jgi:ubiquinone/menaquinone biosynthesis C-methylase UbiE
VVGIDPDPKALGRARRKAAKAAGSIQFDQGFGDDLPYAEASFDRVFSSFMFHHLERDDKARTLREVRRVLKPAGSLHLLDFAGPDGSGHGARLRGLHAHHRLIDNGERTIAHLLGEAGFNNVTQARERVWLGLVQILTYRASRT